LEDISGATWLKVSLFFGVFFFFNPFFGFWGGDGTNGWLFESCATKLSPPRGRLCFFHPSVTVDCDVISRLATTRTSLRPSLPLVCLWLNRFLTFTRTFPADFFSSTRARGSNSVAGPISLFSLPLSFSYAANYAHSRLSGFLDGRSGHHAAFPGQPGCPDSPSVFPHLS